MCIIGLKIMGTTRKTASNGKKDDAKKGDSIPAKRVVTAGKGNGSPPVTTFLVSTSPFASAPTSIKENSKKLSPAAAAIAEAYIKKEFEKKESKVVQKLDFSELGIKTKAADSKKSKDSNLLLAVVNNDALVFRCQPKDPALNSWSEKVLFDAMREKDGWAREANLDERALLWYKDNIPMLNNREYGIRLFLVQVEDTHIPDSSLLKLGNYIADRVNEEKKNDTVLEVDPKSFFWMRDAVWSELIGEEAALKRLSTKSSTTFGEDYFDKHRDLILKYFREGKLTPNAARILCAPYTEVDPSYFPEELLETEDNGIQEMPVDEEENNCDADDE
jgi:hypothetical protein